MLRETTFRVGGVLMIALGVLLGYGLYTAGAGAEFYDAWLAVPLSVVLGAFFLHVARSEGRERRVFLRTSLEPQPPGPGR